MYVHLGRPRARSPEHAREACRLFSHDLPTHQEAGFLYGLCAVSVADPCDVVFFTHWANRAAAEHWFRSARFQQIVQAANKLFVNGMPDIEAFEVLGE